jgi:hypothetical protein
MKLEVTFMGKLIIELSEENLTYLYKSLNTIHRYLDMMIETNRKLLENWDTPKKADYLGQGSNV